VTGIGNGLDL